MDKQTQEIMFGSANDGWETPDNLYAELDEEFHFTIDVCATKNNAKCDTFISPEENMLESYWVGTGFMNPPYSKPEKPCKEKCKKKKCPKRGYHLEKYKPGQIDFVARASVMASQGVATTVCLLPVRTDTDLFHKFIWDKDKKEPRDGVEVRFLPGRLKFKGAKDCAPFPSMIVIFKSKN